MSMVMLPYPNPITLSSIENLSHINGSNTATVRRNTTSNVNSISAVNNGNKGAKVVLTRHPSSHEFVERTLILDKPAKIGRSVGHNKASANNGFFDCKVLSRNHATIWFDNGKFFIRDTKSSNGTFINTERLSKTNEDSAPRELYSGDTVQFGVDVLENTRNVTHGCIIATLKLFLPNGQEAVHVPETRDGNKVSLEDLYHLNQYLQESLQREQMLETKLNSLQSLMKTLRDSTELSWKALISNNSLLSRVELLEVQLQCYSKKFAEDKLREELRLLQEGKNAYEGVVKQYFQKILDEKIEATQQCQDLNRALDDTKTEFANTQTMISNYQTELRELASKNSILEASSAELESKLRALNEENQELMEKLTTENSTLLNQVKVLSETEEILQRTIEELETRGEYAHKKVTSLQNQVDDLQQRHRDILCELIDPVVIKDKMYDVDLAKLWLSVYAEATQKCRESTLAMRDQVKQLLDEKQTRQREVTTLESELDKCAAQLRNYEEERAEIEAKINERKTEIEMFSPMPDILDEINEKRCNETDALEIQERKKLLNVVQRDIGVCSDRLKELEDLLRVASEDLCKVSVSLADNEQKLIVSENQLNNLDAVVRTLREHVNNANAYETEKICLEDVQSLKKQLSDAHEIVQKKHNVTEKLIEHFSNFIVVINEKLNVVETSLEMMKVSEEDDLAEELNWLKMESGNLVLAVNDLQLDLCSLNYFVDRGKFLDLGELAADTNLVPREVETDYNRILRAKCRSLVEEKTIIEREYANLKEQYESLKNYPYFEMYFILPFLVIVFACIFNFGDRFSLLFAKK